jgi:hypothetical protein
MIYAYRTINPGESLTTSMKLPRRRLFSTTPARELFLIFMAGLATFAISAFYNLFESFSEFSRRHENWNIDEILVLCSILCLGLFAFGVRRWRESLQSELELRARNESLEKALAEIQQLQGILPICSSCKKIRDDHGYWHQVESYIRDHTNVDFSHSLCPDCAAQLYPEYFEPASPE